VSHDINVWPTNDFVNVDYDPPMTSATSSIAMTSRQASRRLGIKIETLYAYVSRGIVHSQPSADGRTSTFDPREIEALARRGRPRQSSRSTSLSMLIETRLTSLSATGVRYRGLLSADLALTHTFEDVAELLWLGRLGTSREPWAGTAFEAEHGLGLGDSLRVTAARAAAHLPRATTFAAADVAVVGRRLIATLTDSLPIAGDGRVPRLVLPTDAISGGSTASAPLRSTIAGRVWTRLSPRRPSSGMLAVVNAALVLMADHDLATSTFAVRVAASTRADPGAVVNAGLGVLSGPLHGSASTICRRMLDRAVEVGATRSVAEILASGQHIPGFGHSVYVGVDPRAALLLDLLHRCSGRNRAIDIADDVHTAVVERIDQQANVDFALATLTMATGMPLDGGEVIMSIARVAGWLAHAIEEYDETALRFRPRASYIGQ
jgi:citrate synthase